MKLRSVVITALLIGCGGSACRSRSSSARSPSLEELAAGSPTLMLGISEAELSALLGREPVEHSEKDRLVEAIYRIEGESPVTITASFLGGPLTGIDCWLTQVAVPPLPRLSKEVANLVATGPLAMKAIQHALKQGEALKMADVLAVTASPGRRVGFGLKRTFEAGTPGSETISTWFWEVEPGGKVLVVVEHEGWLEQPRVRDLPH